jgi:hypothetical protein
MSEKNYERSLRVNMDKKVSSDLDFIKDYYGFQLDADCIRFLIKEKCRDLKEKEK